MEGARNRDAAPSGRKEPAVVVQASDEYASWRQSGHVQLEKDPRVDLEFTEGLNLSYSLGAPQSYVSILAIHG